MSATIDDRRTPEQKRATLGLVVATDNFMSGWGQAQGRSIFAVPFRTWQEGEIVADNMRARSEMRRVRIVGDYPGEYRPKLRKGDHLSIRDMSPCPRFYAPGGFHEGMDR